MHITIINEFILMNLFSFKQLHLFFTISSLSRIQADQASFDFFYESETRNYD